MNNMIERKEYLKQLLSWKDQSIIKVLTGIRRCGKSTILKLYQEYLLNNGIDPSQIISINFEELEYEDLQDYKKLYQYIKDRLVENKMMYIFLDEIQNVPSYEKVVDSLHVKENIDIYITGSNSYIFSGQLATYLSGRYIEIPVLPLSFKEVYNPQTNKEEAFQKYIKTGGFPYIHQIQLLNEQIDMYLEGIYNTVIVKDIEEDIKKDRYNPIKPIYKEADFEKQWEQVLTVNIAECTGEFEQLPIIDDAEIMRNILYSGVWIRYEKAKGEKA